MFERNAALLKPENGTFPNVFVRGEVILEVKGEPTSVQAKSPPMRTLIQWKGPRLIIDHVRGPWPMLPPRLIQSS